MIYDTWYIYGAGGLGAETVDILKSALKFKKTNSVDLRFIDDSGQKNSIFGLPVHAYEDCTFGKVTIAIGEPAIRKKIFEKIEKSSLKISSILAPSAVISSNCQIENGVIVGPLCSIQARAEIKTNVAVNTMAIIGHDVTVGKNAVISSMANLGGGVVIGDNSYIGMGALIKEGINIGSNSIIGMGSVVYNDIPDGMIALGNPARVARKNEEKKVFK